MKKPRKQHKKRCDYLVTFLHKDPPRRCQSWESSKACRTQFGEVRAVSNKDARRVALRKFGTRKARIVAIQRLDC